MVDAQSRTETLERMGATEIDREEYLERIQPTGEGQDGRGSMAL